MIVCEKLEMGRENEKEIMFDRQFHLEPMSNL